MKKITLLFIISFLVQGIYAQKKTTLVGNLPFTQAVNDVWGWADEDGTEYALVGLQEGVAVVSLANPANPIQVAFANGPSSSWRDIKTWKDHAYAINETSDGLLIMDLSTLPDSMSYSYWEPGIEGAGILSDCHNLYIDEFGVAYLTGCNINSGGMVFVDVDTDQKNPTFLGLADARYSHDVYVRDNIMYSSDIYEGFFSITDVSDKTNTQLLATQSTPSRFTHNTWLSDDSQTLFTTDERSNAPVAAYDISDLDNIEKLDEFRPAASINTGVIPHNVHVLEDYLVISHYSDGVVIVDAARPHNLIEVGDYDTFTGNGTGFSGAWGAYPFLPSGLVLVSDRSSGLFVVQPDYKRAAYLEGTVTDADSGMPLNDVDITINIPNYLEETTDLEGNYATGTVEAGTYEATFSKLGYRSKTVEVTLENGELTALNVELEGRLKIRIFGKITDKDDQSPISEANIGVINNDITYLATTASDGTFTIDDVITGEYEIVVGAWGFQQKVIAVEAESNQELNIALDFGYEDDFVLDLGWEVESTARTGQWERAEPIGTGNPSNYSNPAFDLDSDLGNLCYVTGNGGMDAAFDDVDDGYTILTSPIMDLTSYQSPILSYHIWLALGGGDGNPNDTLQVFIDNGIERILLIDFINSTRGWTEALEFDLIDVIEITDEMQVSFVIQDLPESGHLVEAGVDGFKIIEGEMISDVNTLVDSDQISIYPNPFNDYLQLELDIKNTQNLFLELYDHQGRLLSRFDLKASDTQTLQLPTHLANGVYWVSLVADGVLLKSQSIVKQ